MICFRDMTFCINYDDCANKECNRHWNDDLRQQSINWWGDDNAPVAFGIFKDTCGKFLEKKD